MKPNSRAITITLPNPHMPSIPVGGCALTQCLNQGVTFNHKVAIVRQVTMAA